MPEQSPPTHAIALRRRDRRLSGRFVAWNIGSVRIISHTKRFGRPGGCIRECGGSSNLASGAQVGVDSSFVNCTNMAPISATCNQTQPYRPFAGARSPSEVSLFSLHQLNAWFFGGTVIELNSPPRPQFGCLVLPCARFRIWGGAVLARRATPQGIPWLCEMLESQAVDSPRFTPVPGSGQDSSQSVFLHSEGQMTALHVGRR